MSELLVSSGDVQSPLPAVPQLFHLDPIDVVDGWQQELVDSYQGMMALIGGKSQVEVHDALQQKASESMRGHGELVNGLVYAILTEPTNGAMYFRHLSIVSRDGYAHAVGRLQILAAAPKFHRLQNEVRQQLLYMVGELVRARATGTEQIVLNLTRQMRGGDVTSTNIRLCRQMLHLLETHYDWLLEHPALVATAAYAFGRLTLDHGRVSDLRDQESRFAARLLRDRFADCAMVGRDLVRMLQDVARHPAFRSIWSDLLKTPQRLSAHLTDVGQLMRVPTPRIFLANRLTFEMEARLLFILEHVPVSSYGRNLTWFVQRFLGTPEAETLYADVVRYICGVCHPSNAVLASNIVPRYVFLGGLLRFVRSQVVAANAKLALFFDWLFFDARSDSIMNIEPGVLMMARSVDKYTYLTASLIEFLAFVCDAYYPPLAADIREGVAAAMRDAVEKGVVPGLLPLYEHPRIDAATRRHMYFLWKQLVPPPSDLKEGENENENEDEDEGGAQQAHAEVPEMDEPLPLPAMTPPQKQPDETIVSASASVSLSASVDQPPAIKSVDPASLDPVSRMFHDDAASPASPAIESTEQPISLGEDVQLKVPGSSDTDGQAQGVESALQDPSLWLFGSTLTDFLQLVRRQYQGETSERPSSESVKEIVDVFAQSEASVSAVACVIAQALDSSLLADIETNAELARMGENDSLEQDTLDYVFSAIVPYLAQPNGRAGERVLDLLVHLTEHANDVGFRWLLFCVISDGSSNQDANCSKAEYYQRYVARYENGGSLGAALSRDLRLLQERFPTMFYDVLEPIYRAFPQHLPGLRSVVKAVVAMVDQPQVYRLSLLLSARRLVLFGKRAASVISDLLDAADAFEQVCLWQLVAAEIGGDSLAVGELVEELLVRRNLDPRDHSEAACGLVAVLRTVRPNGMLVQALVNYAAAGGISVRLDLCASVLSAWWKAAQSELLGLISGKASDSAWTELVNWWKTNFLSHAGSLASCEMVERALLAAVPKQETESTEKDVLDQDDPSTVSASDIVQEIEERGTKRPRRRPRAGSASGSDASSGGPSDSESQVEPPARRIATRASSSQRQISQTASEASSHSSSSRGRVSGGRGRGRGRGAKKNGGRQLRRNVITSDDEENEDEENEGESGHDGFSIDSSLSSNSSPLVSSSDSDTDGKEDAGDDDF
ncbi:hypothetical protein J3B02_002627 [Coemansia erecta]|nr:hypothetical protein J3B02_002627 [Coemansia erecta]